MNEINDILNDITCQTIAMYGNNISEKMVANFRKYLEDIVLFDIIRCDSDALSFYSVGREVSKNIRIALIASGISRDGMIPFGECYRPVKTSVKKHDYYFAKRATRENDADRFKSFKLNVMSLMDEYREQPEKLDLLQFLSLGLSQNERNCGYVEDKESVIEFCESELQTMWMIRKKYLEENVLKNSLEYSICSEIFQRPLAKHYPLATSLALCEMAMTDEFVRTNGLESLNQEYIEYVLRNIKAAKITDYDIISKYEGRFRDIISPKKGMLDNIAKLVKVPKRETNKD